jgi:hypothetical protein
LKKGVVVNLSKDEISTVLSIKRMGLLILAGISLPSKICFVDFADENIHLVGRFMLQVHVMSLFVDLLLGYLSFAYLSNGFKVNWLDSLGRDDFVILDVASVE